MNLDADILIFCRIDKCKSHFLVQIDVVEHGHEDYSITETFRCDALSFMVFLKFWISSEAVVPGKIFLSSAIGSPLLFSERMEHL